MIPQSVDAHDDVAANALFRRDNRAEYAEFHRARMTRAALIQRSRYALDQGDAAHIEEGDDGD